MRRILFAVCVTMLYSSPAKAGYWWELGELLPTPPKSSQPDSTKQAKPSTPKDASRAVPVADLRR